MTWFLCCAARHGHQGPSATAVSAIYHVKLFFPCFCDDWYTLQDDSFFSKKAAFEFCAKDEKKGPAVEHEFFPRRCRDFFTIGPKKTSRAEVSIHGHNLPTAFRVGWVDGCLTIVANQQRLQ
jgi:hypothetical protein